MKPSSRIASLLVVSAIAVAGLRPAIAQKSASASSRLPARA
jgi:hypothetical protein